MQTVPNTNYFPLLMRTARDNGRRQWGYSRSSWSPQRPLRGDTTSRLQSENVERKRMLRGSPPEMSPRKMSRPETEKMASSMAPQKSASLVGPAVAAPRRSFWDSPRRKEAPSDSFRLSVVQSGRKSAREQKSADGFTRAEQRQSDTQLSASSQRKSMKLHKNLEGEKTQASTSSRRTLEKKKSAIKFSISRQGSSFLQSPRKENNRKSMKPVKRPTGYKVHQEIKRYQSSAATLIPRLPFARVVHEVLVSVAGDGIRMQKLALKALHEASEAVIVAVLEGANVLAHHSRRVTLMNRDLDTFLTLIRNYGTMQCSLS